MTGMSAPFTIPDLRARVAAVVQHALGVALEV